MIATCRPFRVRRALASPDEDPKRAPDPPVSAPPSRRAALFFVGALVAVLAIVGAVALLTGGEDEGESEEMASTDLVCEPLPDDGGSAECPSEIANEPANVEVVTSEGDFTIALDTENWPATSTSFRNLVEQGSYDDNGFHRVVPGFVIQGGDPYYGDDQNADLLGSGGAGYYVDENVPRDTTYPDGTIAMAKNGTDPPGRSGSQFFVVAGGGGGQLTPDYAIAGQVSEGLDVVEAINALGEGEGPPSKPVTIESMTLVPAA